MNHPRLFYAAIRERNEDGSHTGVPGEPEWFVELDGKVYRLTPALTCPEVPVDWLKSCMPAQGV